ncbi:MAG: hypothetical protein SPL30_08090 [Succinivibrio sp.]|jgi:hypothetical protein|nr:hypothetical protein [Succinivibrio sp.]
MLVLIVLLLFSFTLFALMAGRGAVIYMSLVLSPLLTAIGGTAITDVVLKIAFPSAATGTALLIAFALWLAAGFGLFFVLLKKGSLRSVRISLRDLLHR